ncbi:MAG: hypothetical protein MJE12_23545 [Alphaproteobacteria bacterium]|nr:hypothetical protein [Alphaproteobacteria bacterium]
MRTAIVAPFGSETDARRCENTAATVVRAYRYGGDAATFTASGKISETSDNLLKQIVYRALL